MRQRHAICVLVGRNISRGGDLKTLNCHGNSARQHCLCMFEAVRRKSRLTLLACLPLLPARANSARSAKAALRPSETAKAAIFWICCGLMWPHAYSSKRCSRSVLPRVSSRAAAWKSCTPNSVRRFFLTGWEAIRIAKERSSRGEKKQYQNLACLVHMCLQLCALKFVSCCFLSTDMRATETENT